jgi:hypothetical protein
MSEFSPRTGCILLAIAVIAWAGTNPKAAVQAVATASSGAKSSIEALRNAIIGQESGGDHKLTNASGSGAMGLGQVMPENVGPWTKQCLGRELSAEEFLASVELQTKTIDCKIAEYHAEAIKKAGGDEKVAAKRVAAQWYSGDPEKYASTAPQSWAGDEYPSISSYADSVAAKYEKQKRE